MGVSSDKQLVPRNVQVIREKGDCDVVCFRQGRGCSGLVELKHQHFCIRRRRHCESRVVEQRHAIREPHAGELHHLPRLEVDVRDGAEWQSQKGFELAHQRPVSGGEEVVVAD